MSIQLKLRFFFPLTKKTVLENRLSTICMYQKVRYINKLFYMSLYIKICLFNCNIYLILTCFKIGIILYIPLLRNHLRLGFFTIVTLINLNTDTTPGDPVGTTIRRCFSCFRRTISHIMNIPKGIFKIHATSHISGRNRELRGGFQCRIWGCMGVPF